MACKMIHIIKEITFYVLEMEIQACFVLVFWFKQEKNYALSWLELINANTNSSLLTETDNCPPILPGTFLQTRVIEDFKQLPVTFFNLQVFEGNRPSNSILFQKLTPFTLGLLIGKSLYLFGNINVFWTGIPQDVILLQIAWTALLQLIYM